MRSAFLYLNIIILSILAFSYVGCAPSDPPPPQYPTYNFTEPIVNPPDTFQVLYNISTVGDKFAYVTFEKDAVWFIEKLGDPRINYWIINDTGNYGILVSDTLGLKAGYTYVFGANNNNYLEFTNFFTQFNKTAFDYTTFEPKF